MKSAASAPAFTPAALRSAAMVIELPVVLVTVTVWGGAAGVTMLAAPRSRFVLGATSSPITFPWRPKVLDRKVSPPPTIRTKLLPVGLPTTATGAPGRPRYLLPETGSVMKVPAALVRNVGPTNGGWKAAAGVTAESKSCGTRPGMSFVKLIS